MTEGPLLGFDPGEILRPADTLRGFDTEYIDIMGGLVVIKIGTRTLINPNGTVRRCFMRAVASDVNTLRQHGVYSVIVSSGARAYGEFILRGRDPTLEKSLSDPLHSAVGQARVMQVWKEEFSRATGLTVAQFLLAEGDNTDYVSTMQEFMRVGVPIVNWNDAAFGIIGQNDTLTEKIAFDMGAGSVIFFTNKPGVLDHEGERIPHLYPGEGFAHLIQEEMSEGGTGGMGPKLDVSFNLANNNIKVFILDRDHPEGILQVAEGQDVGTKIAFK